jgi:uncharacterized membrane protein YphA (DoxX/SURF4 family)
MARIHLLGRIVLGAFYLFNAANHFANARIMATYAAARGVPVPTLAVVTGGVLLAIAGVAIILGVFPKLAVGALVLFFVPVTFIMHAFWADQTAVARMNDFVNFAKNVALLASACVFLAIPEPWPYSLRTPRARVSGRELRPA